MHPVIDAPSVVLVSPSDSVAVALRDLAPGEDITLPHGSVKVLQPVGKGHKIAARAISAGSTVVKFGAPIGVATSDIAAGEHVHTHNVRSALAQSGSYAYAGCNAVFQTPIAREPGFDGYRRKDGRVGTRNEIWIIATVGCVASVCQEIAKRSSELDLRGVDGVFAITHPFGCSQLGSDLDDTRNILAALARHPNAGGVVFVGLGCESNQLGGLVKAAGLEASRMRTVLSQEAEDEIEAGVEAVADLALELAQDRREACALADLVIGLKCGGSDGFSGLSANPLLGAISDRVTVAGGSAILTEIPEIFGAEHVLLDRAADRETFDQLADLVNTFKAYFVAHGEPVDENPSPGNKAGGITTLAEKSLGAVQKAGQAPVQDVLKYGAMRRKSGLSILEAPGNDAVSSTALAAAGATLILFTTGRGTPLGFPAPTVKIASNQALAARKPRWIDFDASPLLAGEPMDTMGERFLDYLCAVASGQRTRNELNGERAIAIWKRGVTL
jgi:altronate hydrolase